MSKLLETLPGLTASNMEQLLVSVGKTPRARRPLSPVEVGTLCKKAMAAGANVQDITAALHMTDKSMVPKFVRLLTLPAELGYLVTWGASEHNAIGFSVAAQLGRLPAETLSAAAEAVLKFGLTRNEMTSLSQLLQRSGQSLEACVDRIVKRRPIVRVQEVVMGAVTSAQSRVKLARIACNGGS